MASAIRNCIVCYEEDENFLLCSSCNEACCLGCMESYKKLECPSCLESYPDIVFKDYFEDYSNLYINFYIYHKAPYDDHTNEKIVSYFREMEIKKNLFWGEKVNIIIGTSSLSCKKCHNIIKTDGVCLECKNRVCLTCEDDWHGEEPCSPEVLENIKNIRETCKKCPCCYAYIYRIEGCSHMNCSYCGASFDWANPNVIQKDKYEYKKIKNKFINEKMNERYNKRYEELYNKKKEKNDYTISFLHNAPENVAKFVLNIRRDITKIRRIMNKLTIQYFGFIKDTFNAHQGEDLTQLDINSLINQTFKDQFFTVLKKVEYYEKLFLDIKGRSLCDVETIKELLQTVHNTLIIPQKIQFFFDETRSQFLNERVSTLAKKRKNEIILQMEGDEKNEIVPLNHEQTIHAFKVKEILMKYRICLNTSHAGSGKTYTSLYNAAELGIKRIILFCPKITEYKWINIIRHYNNTYQFRLIYFTYSEISSIGFTTNNNVYQTVMDGTRLSIVLKNGFRNRITDDTMIIFDEIHNIKTQSSKAFKFIVAVAEEAVRSRAYILSLSATPIEKKEEISHLAKKIALVKKYEVINILEDPNLLFYRLRKERDPNEFKTLDELFKEFDEVNKKVKNDPKDYSSRLDQAFSFTTERPERTYTAITDFLNDPSFRKMRNDLVNFIRNCIDSGINLREFVRSFTPVRGKYKRNIHPEILNFIFKQNNIARFVTYFYRYISFIGHGTDRKIIKPSIMVTFILCMYGVRVEDAMSLSENFEASQTLAILQKYLFLEKTFNISSYLKNKSEISLPNARMLDIFLKPEDQETLDSAFRQVLIQVNEEVSMTTLQTFALFTKGLIISELIYVSYLTSLIVEMLEKNVKIVIGVHYKETIRRFRSSFEELGYRHLVLDGSVKNKQVIINSFQDNDEYKILITNIACVNTGVDLDDKVGDKPRVVFIVPNFKYSETLQFMYRFKRVDSKSEPFILLLNNHMKIVNILLRKNKINQEIKTSLLNLGEMLKINEQGIFDELLKDV